MYRRDVRIRLWSSGGRAVSDMVREDVVAVVDGMDGSL